MSDDSGPVQVRGRRVWLIAGAILTVAALLLGSLGAVTALATATQDETTETAREHHTYPRAAARVEVSLALGEVSIAGGDRDRVEIARELTWSGDRPAVDESWVGDTLRVDLTCAHSFLQWATDTCSVDYAAAVPRDTAAAVDTSTAAIDVRDLHGALALTATTGAITVEDVTGPLSAQATTGDITGSDLRTRQAEVEVTTGAVDLRFAEPPDWIRATATTGPITIEVPRGDAYRVDVESTGGSPRVEVAQHPDAERVIEVSATTSEVHIRYAA